MFVHDLTHLVHTSIHSRRKQLVLVLFSLFCMACSPLVAPPTDTPICTEDTDCPAKTICKNSVCVETQVHTEIRTLETKDEPPSSEPHQDAGEPDQSQPPENECIQGTTRPCYSAPRESLKHAPCKEGQQTCRANRTWGPCENEHTPQPETCDGIDNNCDGQIDENFAQKDKPCKDLQQKGECQNGTYTECKQGALVCHTPIQPGTQKEVCDGKDNDCDGKTDDLSNCKCTPQTTRSCGNDLGECTQGKEVCDAQGKWGACTGGNSPQTEQCNGLDDDCDGQTDEDFKQLGKPCSLGSGSCKTTGTWICRKEKVACSATPKVPQKEVCNKLDDDCDGQIDEDFKQLGKTCSIGQGECQTTGQIVCQSLTSTHCNAQPIKPSTEICDGKDNDCDGKTDEDFPQLGKACSSGLGECKQNGTYQCKNNIQVCSAVQLQPQAEICDGKDNDCDGQIDEVGCQCKHGEQRSCGLKTGECKQGTQICQTGQWSACKGSVGPQKERCDGKDNNCNGKTDEDFSQLGKACHVGIGECQTKGQWQCDSSGNREVCSAQAGQPTLETCDNKDNDCDGQIDETFPKQSDGCFVPGKRGECKNGKNLCINGVIRCQQINAPQLEYCRDGKDNDCDGQIDEICGPLYDYALVAGSGSVFHNRGFTSITKSSTEFGKYTLNAPVKQGRQPCVHRPPFLTSNSLFPRSISYYCQKQTGSSAPSYVIRTGKNYTHATLPPVGVGNGSFTVVLPQANDVYASVRTATCRNPQGVCRFTTFNKSTNRITAITRQSAGYYTVTSNLCKQPNRPIFASLEGTTPTGFIRAFTYQQTCIIYIRNLQGYPADLTGFSVWLPDTNLNQSAWATVHTAQNAPVVQNYNSFQQSNYAWSSAYRTSTGISSCMGQTSCLRTQIASPSFGNKSAVLIGHRFSIQYMGASVYIQNNQVFVTTLFKNGGQVPMSINPSSFYALFVQ